MGYCKHRLHAHALLNEDSDYVIIDHWLKYKGNTKITKRQRGRVRDALPALQVIYMFVILFYGTICSYNLYYKQSCAGIIYDNRFADDIIP
jgi:hypothetical protein